jgi:hypothetical protein
VAFFCNPWQTESIPLNSSQKNFQVVLAALPASMFKEIQKVMEDLDLLCMQ